MTFYNLALNPEEAKGICRIPSELIMHNPWRGFTLINSVFPPMVDWFYKNTGWLFEWFVPDDIVILKLSSA